MTSRTFLNIIVARYIHQCIDLLPEHVNLVAQAENVRGKCLKLSHIGFQIWFPGDITPSE